MENKYHIETRQLKNSVKVTILKDRGYSYANVWSGKSKTMESALALADAKLKSIQEDDARKEAEREAFEAKMDAAAARIAKPKGIDNYSGSGAPSLNPTLEGIRFSSGSVTFDEMPAFLETLRNMAEEAQAYKERFDAEVKAAYEAGDKDMALCLCHRFSHVRAPQYLGECP